MAYGIVQVWKCGMDDRPLLNNRLTLWALCHRDKQTKVLFLSNSDSQWVKGWHNFKDKIKRLIHIDFQIQEIFPETVANPINKRVHSTSLFIEFASLEGNISCIWKSMWINRYIIFFFKDHFKFNFPSVLMFWKGLCWSIATITRKYTWKVNFYGCHFVLKRGRLPLTNPWIVSERRILHFAFTVSVCPATGPGDFKFIMDSLSLFELNETFLIAKN